MILKCLSTGSAANCYVLKRDNGEMLILDAGLPMFEIKKGIGFDVKNLKGAIISHSHLDHSRSAIKLKNLTPVWEPYRLEAPRIHTHLGEFDIQSFPLPHNGVENRGFIIRVDGQTICYLTDYEYCAYDLSSQNIDTLLIELNYQEEMVDDEMDEHKRHVVLGHASEKVVVEILRQNAKNLRNVILCHMSNSGHLDRDKAMGHIRGVLPEYVQIMWAKAGRSYNISLCPF